jgi:hypothetical protein
MFLIRITVSACSPAAGGGPMQRFNAPLAPEDRKFARGIQRILFITYSSMALVLATGVVAHIILKSSTVASAPEATTTTAAIGGSS